MTENTVKRLGLVATAAAAVSAVILLLWTLGMVTQAQAFEAKAPSHAYNVDGKMLMQQEGEPSEVCYTTDGVVNWLRGIDPGIQVSVMRYKEKVGLLALFSDGSGVIFLAADDDGFYCTATYISDPEVLFRKLTEAVRTSDLVITLIWPEPKDTE